MKFADPQTEREYKDGLEADVRNLVDALDQWSRENDIPEVVVTEVHRTPEENEKTYVTYALTLIRKLQAGQGQTDSERALAIELVKRSLPELRVWAREKFTWHSVWCAVDLRTRHYKASHLVEVVEFLQKRVAGIPHELILHSVAGPHLHLALKKADKRAAIQ